MMRQGLDWLEDNAAAAFADDPNADPGEHLGDERLADLAESGGSFAPAELAHLARCEECATVAAHLYGRREAPNVVPIRPWRRHAPLIITALPIAAALVFVALTSDDLRSKGGPPPLDADVVVLAVGPDGHRDLTDGAAVRTGEQLGFRYGNVKGRHTTLTVVGWDGASLHWFYPDEPSGEAFEIRRDPDAQNLRLPFDIKLDADHPRGTLVVAACFDTAPKAVAETLRDGTAAGDPRCRVRSIVVESEAP
jgi:hypothetical protein